MSVTDRNTVPQPTPEQRRIAAERFERANQVIATGDYDYGIQLLLTCCKLDPANLLFRQTLRRTQKAKFKNNMHGSRLAMLTNAGPKTRIKSAKRGREYLKVLEVGEEILSRNPWDLGTQMDMAEAADALGLLDLAIFFLDQARQKYPNDATLNRALARLFEKRGNFTHAITLWQLVQQAVPGDVEAAHKAKDLAASETIQRGKYETASGSAEQAVLSGGSGRLGSKPASNQQRAFKAEPTDRASREAAPILARLDANPTDPNLYLQLAGVYRRANQPDRARAVLEQGLGPTGRHYVLTLEIMDLDLDPFRRNLALTEQKIKQAEARPDDDLPVEGPSLEELERARSRLLKEINSREVELYRLKADRFPSEQGHRVELGLRLLRADQIEEAIVELQQARKDPRLAWRASMYLGFCFKRRNNWRLAQRNFEEALTAVPPNEESSRKEILFTLAKGCAEAGDLSKAVDVGHELANLDFGYRDIGRLIDEWQHRLENA
jgi:tetratricopeptide (TPR) repeat protein